MRDHARGIFRNAAHTPGVAAIKPRDFLPFQEGDTVEAPSPYAAWHELLATKQILVVGDLLETETGDLFLCKYVGFEKGQWVLPEASTDAAAAQPAQVEAKETADVS
jgi:hypothetical protein